MQREYPSAPVAAVACVVLREGAEGRLEVLLVRRGQAPSYGRWGLPGGAIELGEGTREAAAREVREECGIEVAPDRVIEVLDAITKDQAGKIRYHYVLIEFLAEYQGGELRPSSDALDARWFALEELSGIDMQEITRRVIWAGAALRQKGAEGGPRLWQSAFWS